jgi:signal transduction histidine kinase/ActR/RegA family two-component response regulator
MTGNMTVEFRVLVHAPRGRDSSVVQSVLGANGLTSHVCQSRPELLRQMEQGAAAAIVTEEVLTDEVQDQQLDGALDQWLQQQPPWSDFPFIVLATKQAPRRSIQALAMLHRLGNVILLERPLDAQTLASAANAAVRARRRQYAARQHLEELSDARGVVERLNRELEDRIVARTKELAGANDRLMREIAERERAQSALLQSQKMEALGRLTGGIAHDFNNLLHVVNISLDIIGRFATDAKVSAVAKRAKDAIGRGSALTGQLLSFARNQSLLPTQVDINALLKGMKELVAVSAGPTISLRWNFSDKQPWALLDANQLEMAVLNLAVNARDAMPNGGSLTISARMSRGTGTSLPPGDYVVVSVSDTGEGIPPQLLSKVFEPFFTTKPVGTGTGLGLSQVYGFAQQSGGLAVVKSELGAGTSVEIYFPAVAPPSQTEQAAEAVRDIVGSVSAQRVLVVEDDAEVRRVIVESLSLIGYEVAEAENGISGLAALKRSPPDLLVVDYAMPDMTGAELIVLARERIPDLPVVLATGYADMAEVGRVVGTQSVLLKPFDISTLAKAASVALNAKDGVRATSS